MSTKLFNGYLLKDMTLLQLQDFAMRVRETLAPISEGLYTRKMAEICTCLLDDRAVYSPEEFAGHAKALCDKEYNPKYGVLVAAHSTMMTHEQNIKRTQTRDPEFDFECEMCVIPTKDRIFMLLYTEQDKYVKAIESMPEVTKYPYWNNTDQPEGVSDEEWEARGKQWDEALSEHIGIPAMNSFGVTCVHVCCIPDAGEIMAAMPSLEDRVKRLAVNIVSVRYMKSMPGEKDVMECYWKSRDYLKTAEGKAELSKESERIRGLLKPSYVKEDLFKECDNHV